MLLVRSRDPTTSCTAGRRYRGGELLGQVSGVGVDAHGDVLVFRRGSRSWLSGADSLSLEPIAEPTVLQFRGRPVS